MAINLCTTDGVSAAIDVGQTNKLSATIVLVAGYSSSSWVVDLQWSLTIGDYEQWTTYSPVIQWSSGTLSRPPASVTNRGYVRFKTTTAQALADPAAAVVWSLR